MKKVIRLIILLVTLGGSFGFYHYFKGQMHHDMVLGMSIFIFVIGFMIFSAIAPGINKLEKLYFKVTKTGPRDRYRAKEDGFVNQYVEMPEPDDWHDN